MEASKRKRQRAYIRGRVSEMLAANMLRLKGYHIVARGYRKPVGEIDIIARRGSLLVAIEVKSRSRINEAAEAISNRQNVALPALSKLSSWKGQNSVSILCASMCCLLPPFGDGPVILKVHGKSPEQGLSTR